MREKKEREEGSKGVVASGSGGRWHAVVPGQGGQRSARVEEERKGGDGEGGVEGDNDDGDDMGLLLVMMR